MNTKHAHFALFMLSGHGKVTNTAKNTKAEGDLKGKNFKNPGTTVLQALPN